MRNWQVIFYVRRDNSFDFPIWKQPPRYPRYESVAPRTTFYYGNFIRGRPTLISSVFDSHRNKLQFDLNRERGRDRERERERERSRKDKKEGREKRRDARKKARTHVNIADFPGSVGRRRACKSTSSRNATDYEIRLNFVGKIPTCRNDLCSNVVYLGRAD